MTCTSLLLLLVAGPARAQDEEPAQEAPAEAAEEEAAEEVPAEETAEETAVAAPEAAPVEEHAPPPVAPAAAATAAVPAAPPSAWTERGRPHAAQAYQGLYLNGSALGGAAVALGLTWVSEPGVALDGSLGLRVGLGADLYVNPVLGAGLAWTGGARVRNGGFVRGGVTLPLPTWTEAFVAGGYALRAQASGGTRLGLDLGLGVMVVQILPDYFQPYPLMICTRLSVDVPVGR